MGNKISVHLDRTAIELAESLRSISRIPGDTGVKINTGGEFIVFTEAEGKERDLTYEESVTILQWSLMNIVTALEDLGCKVKGLKKFNRGLKELEGK